MMNEMSVYPGMKNTTRVVIAQYDDNGDDQLKYQEEGGDFLTLKRDIII